MTQRIVHSITYCISDFLIRQSGFVLCTELRLGELHTHHAAQTRCNVRRGNGKILIPLARFGDNDLFEELDDTLFQAFHVLPAVVRFNRVRIADDHRIRICIQSFLAECQSSIYNDLHFRDVIVREVPQGLDFTGVIDLDDLGIRFHPFDQIQQGIALVDDRLDFLSILQEDDAHLDVREAIALLMDSVTYHLGCHRVDVDDLRIDRELEDRAMLFGLPTNRIREETVFELIGQALPISHGSHFGLFAQIGCTFGTNTKRTARIGVCCFLRVVELTRSIQHGQCIQQCTMRNASAIVDHRALLGFDVKDHREVLAHSVFDRQLIDRVVDDLKDNVKSTICIGARYELGRTSPQSVTICFQTLNGFVGVGICSHILSSFLSTILGSSVRGYNIYPKKNLTNPF